MLELPNRDPYFDVERRRVNMEERLSNCCTANHDGRFHYDDEAHMGICNHCKEHAEFLTEEEADEFYKN